MSPPARPSVVTWSSRPLFSIWRFSTTGTLYALVFTVAKNCFVCFLKLEVFVLQTAGLIMIRSRVRTSLPLILLELISMSRETLGPSQELSSPSHVQVLLSPRGSVGTGWGEVQKDRIRLLQAQSCRPEQARGQGGEQGRGWTYIWGSPSPENHTHTAQLLFTYTAKSSSDRERSRPKDSLSQVSS